MKVVVLGLGLSGKAAANYLKKRGDQILGVDRICPSLADIAVIDESAPIQLNGVDLLIKSPGISSLHPWLMAAKAKNIPIRGEIDLAFEALQKKAKTIFAVTGSNGKTTTSLMAAHLMRTSGKRALAVGNVGVPLLDQIDSDTDVFVVELSSFQLEQIVENKVLDGAVILNITPNHLDRHASFEEYVQAKMRVACCLKQGALLYVSQEITHLVSHAYDLFDVLQEKVETILPLSYRDSLYPHDLKNITAAYALTRVSDETLVQGMATFVRPLHRLEFVRCIAGVNYINDSKATSVDAVIKAVQAIKTPIILIAGGIDKGGTFRDWLPFFKDKVLQVFALGPAAYRMQRELSPQIAVDIISSLEEGVKLSGRLARAGDTVLLSPGCSSYDQFKDYQHRGERFRNIVEEIL